MERYKPTLFDKLQSERGHGERTKFYILIAASLGLTAAVTLNNCEINRLEDKLDALNTPPPAPEVGIDTFENTFNSDLQVVFPE